MPQRIQHGSLQISDVLYHLINDEIIPGTEIDVNDFWASLESIVDDLAPKNRALLEKREQLQKQIDQWHQQQTGSHDANLYKQFLQDIGYLVPEGDDFQITTDNVEPEIAQQAGPQLVVPIMNARFALNAANARWGSLYDALYGTDVIPETDGADKGTSFNPVRGEKVIAFARKFLDGATPLSGGSHAAATLYSVKDNSLHVTQLDGSVVSLQDRSQFIGYQGESAAPTAILLRHNNLHFEIQINREDHIGKSDSAGISDIILEAALTTIMDCEDSVAAVDATDKSLAYRNWLGLMKGDLSENIEKNGQTIHSQDER